MRAALVASCLRGALPPVDLRAVCLVRAMVDLVWVVRLSFTFAAKSCFQPGSSGRRAHPPRTPAPRPPAAATPASPQRPQPALGWIAWLANSMAAPRQTIAIARASNRSASLTVLCSRCREPAKAAASPLARRRRRPAPRANCLRTIYHRAAQCLRPRTALFATAGPPSAGFQVQPRAHGRLPRRGHRLRGARITGRAVTSVLRRCARPRVAQPRPLPAAGPLRVPDCAAARRQSSAAGPRRSSSGYRRCRRAHRRLYRHHRVGAGAGGQGGRGGGMGRLA